MFTGALNFMPCLVRMLFSTTYCSDQVVVKPVSAVVKLVFHEPSDSHRAEKEAIDVELQEKNAEIERLKRELQALRVYNL